MKEELSAGRKAQSQSEALVFGLQREVEHAKKAATEAQARYLRRTPALLDAHANIPYLHSGNSNGCEAWWSGGL